MQSTRRLSDMELATAILDIEQPATIDNLSRERPESDLPPTILGEYHLPTTESAIWCCHCQAHRHWNGFVVENETGSRYLIGSHCGPKHYAFSFAKARTQHNDLKQRQRFVQRLAAILLSQHSLLESIDAVLRSEGLRRIDEVRNAIRKAAGDAFFRLQPIAVAGTALTEFVRVRDFAAEMRRAERNEKENTPLYTFENQGIGPLEGAGLFVEHGDCRDALLALRSALSEARKLSNRGTDTAATGAFQKIVIGCEDAHAKAQQAIALARRAPAFFSKANLQRLERWSEQFDSFSIQQNETGIHIISRNGVAVTITALAAVSINDLPRLVAD